jgi:hypothetical protein
MIGTSGYWEAVFPWIIVCKETNRVSIRILPGPAKAPAIFAN